MHGASSVKERADAVSKAMPQDGCKSLNPRRHTSSCSSERRGSLEARAILGHLGYVRRQSAGDGMISPELPPIRPNSRKSSKSSSNGQNQLPKTQPHIVLDQREMNPSSAGHSSMESLTCASHALLTESNQSTESTGGTKADPCARRQNMHRRISITSVKGSSSCSKKTPPSRHLSQPSAGQPACLNRRQIGGLQRNRSEQSLGSRQGAEGRRLVQETTVNVNRPLKKTVSQPQLNTSKSSEDMLNARNIRRLHHGGEEECNGDDTEEDEGSGATKQRIIKWLIGVDGNAEKPQSPLPVVDEGPAQTDTAIHVVYEEN